MSNFTSFSRKKVDIEHLMMTVCLAPSTAVVFLKMLWHIGCLFFKAERNVSFFKCVCLTPAKRATVRNGASCPLPTKKKKPKHVFPELLSAQRWYWGGIAILSTATSGKGAQKNLPLPTLTLKNQKLASLQKSLKSLRGTFKNTEVSYSGFFSTISQPRDFVLSLSLF